MLVLSRKVGERIQIGNDVELVVLKSSSGRIQLGIDAPRDVPIRRHELLTRNPVVRDLDRENRNLTDSAPCAAA